MLPITVWDNDRSRPIRLDDRHAVDGAGRFLARGGIGAAVGADDDADIDGVHDGIDDVHLEQFIVGNVGFGEEDVHVARHAPGDGMNGEPDIGAVMFEQLGEFTHGVLGLGKRHGAAWDEHDGSSRIEH